jgi:hypothetical protein
MRLIFNGFLGINSFFFFLQEKYEIFKEDIMRLKEDHSHFGDTADITGQNHPSIVEV